MKLTKQAIKRIIKEELEKVLNESSSLPHFEKIMDYLGTSKEYARQAISIIEMIPEYGVIHSEEKYGKIMIFFKDESVATEIYDFLERNASGIRYLSPMENEVTGQTSFKMPYKKEDGTREMAFHVGIYHY